MTETPENPSPLPSRRTLVAASLTLLLFAILITLAALYDYDTAKQFSGLRLDCLIALIVAAIGATSCLAGLIHLLDLPATSAPKFLRFSLHELKRPLLALQLLTGTAALASAGILIFHLNLPGPEIIPPPRHTTGLAPTPTARISTLPAHTPTTLP